MGENPSSCSPVPRGLGETLSVLVEPLARFLSPLSLIFSVVSSLSLWQAAGYWTFHARERIFDFASQRLTYRYPDFLERFRQVNADDFIAYDFVVFRLQAAMCMPIGSVHVSKLCQLKLKFEVKAHAEMCE